MAKDEKKVIGRNSYQLSEKATNFIEVFNEQTHVTKHKIVSNAVEFAAENKDGFLKFVFKDALKE